MSKQDEIKTGLGNVKLSAISYDGKVNRPHFLSPIDVKNILAYLHSQGVVIKVERVDRCDDCPHNHYHNGSDAWDNRPSNDCDLLFQLPKGCHKHTTNGDGYVAVEPLIKEDKVRE